MSKIIKIASFPIAIALLALAMNMTCCSPFYNLPKNKEAIVKSLPSDNDSTLVFVALSGGGTRAAAMSWATLTCLKQIPYDSCSNVADEIDYISGISGGSFAAAGWCLYRDSMEVFRKNFVQENVQWDLAKKLLLPWCGLRVFFSRAYDRINIAAEYYDKNVFEKKTFGDLPPRPILWINSTHLALGNRFTYTTEYFDLLTSDLDKYPLGYACAASSAFPILLTPITLINYGETLPDSVLMQEAKYRMAKRNSRTDIEKDFYCRTREFYNNKSNKWMHYADGGLVDNQGLQVILDQFRTNGIINKRLNDPTNVLKRLIIINVNAGTVADDESCTKVKEPGIGAVINYTMTTSMDMLSAKRWMEIKKVTTELWQTSEDAERQSIKEQPYCIEINFRNVENTSLRDMCNKLPTSFYLNKKQLALIDSVVPGLVSNDPDMVRLKKMLQQNK